MAALLQSRILFIALTCIAFCASNENPTEKEFEENRQIYLQQDKEKILKKLDNVLSSMKNDPSLGFPVIKPKANENKIVRHILIYNRLSPPNSLRCGEFSSKNEFYAWIDQSPGRQNKIELILQSRENVQFPNVELLSSRKFDREEINELQFSELQDNIKLRWNGILSVRSMRMDIPIIISYDARENQDAEFYVKEPIVYTAKNSEYKYQVFAKPKVIRWKVGPSVPVVITVNNNKPIRPAVPDGRNRKFKIKFHNNLMDENEYISLFIGPLIDELEAAPLTYFYGLDIQSGIRSSFIGEWKVLTQKRGDKEAPYFQYERFWPWTLCAHMEIIPANKYQLSQIANSISKIKAVWEELSEQMSSALSVDPRDANQKKKKMKKHIETYVCEAVAESFCRNEDADAALTKQQKINVRCGVWPQRYTLLYTGNDGHDDERTLRYKIHPIVPEKTPITMIFGYFAGIKDGKTTKYNDRFHKPNSFYLSNSFMYVSNIAGNKMLRASCSIKAEIDETKCCKIKLPFKSFNKQNVEREFDLLVISASDNIELLSYPTLLKSNPRLQFRKGATKATGIFKVTERFCYKPKAYGRYQIRFEIVAACKMFGKCQNLGERSVDKLGTKQDKTDVIAPKDFQIPLPLSVIVPQFKLKDVKIIPEGSGQGDISEVINEQWFRLRIFFLGSIKGKVTITPNNQRFSFKPESIEFNDGDFPFGSIEAKAEIDCPSATRIMVLNYQIDDELLMWEIPNPTLLQIAPNPKNIEEINEVQMDRNESVLCNLPDDFCMEEGVICGTKNEIANETVCIKYPQLCDEPLPQKQKPDLFKMWILYVLYSCVGLLIFVIIYRNCCGGDGKAMSLLMSTMKDLNKDLNNKPLPKSAINAGNFMNLAGLDEDAVLSADNPNPLLLAEAQLSLQKMLSAMKKR